MSQKIIFIDTKTGIVQHFAEYTVDIFENGQMLENGTTAIIVDKEPTNISDFIRFSYYKSGNFKTLPNKPGEEYEWNLDTELWIYSQELADNKLEKLIYDVKTQRDYRLYLSDWTDTVSAQTRLTNYEEWQTYRQALRDITKQEGYPLNVVWPSQPN